MKIPNPIKNYREKKAEEKRRKEAERKKQQKRTLLICAGIFAALFVIIGIGALTEDDTPQLPEPSSQVETIVDESSVPEEVTPEVTSEPDSSVAESSEPQQSATEAEAPESTAPTIDLASIPAYSGNPYVEINGNIPNFIDADLTTTSFETYSSLDSLGRCGVAYANIGTDLMPTEDRSSIGQVKPTGWHTVKYDCVDGKYLYNRCHLIGYQLTAENANTKNLITGTRYLNVEGMLPFENMVADYIKETGNHVLYRVTPIFEGNNLVASGVLMEAKSVEDNGDGILFNVYCYNVQPSVTIDYATGDSSLNSDMETGTPSAEQNATVKPETPAESNGTTYILNTNTKKFHYPTCSSVDQMSASNRKEYTGSRDDLILQGYEPCKRCNP